MSKDIWTAAVAARDVHVHLPLIAATAEFLPMLERARQAKLQGN